MTGTITATRKARGRPKVDAKQIGLRLPPTQLAQLDVWIARQPDPKPSRPEAIRCILDDWLRECGYLSQDRGIRLDQLTSENVD
jgi:hypothetical protein